MRVHGVCSMGIAIVVIGMVSIAHSGVPPLVNYQGVLLDGAGKPVTSQVSVQFTIYDDSVGGDSKWAETRTVSSDSSGCFSIVLGEVAAISDTVFRARDRWLGTQVGTDPEMTPRERITAAPYAHRVATVDGATGGTITGDVNVNSDLNVNGSVLGAKFVERDSTNYYVDPGNSIRSAVLKGRVGIRGAPFWWGAFPGVEWGPDLHINAGLDTARLWLGGSLAQVGAEVGHLSFVGSNTTIILPQYGPYAGIAAEISGTGGGSTYAAGALRFFTATGYPLTLPPTKPGYAEWMRITRLGEIGIGTSNPTAIVHIHDDDAGTPQRMLRLTNSTTGTGISDGLEIGFWTENSRDIYLHNMENGFLSLGTNSAGRIRILPNGYVGINTVNPGYPLDVAGDCHATSFPTSSDDRLKTNVEPLTNVLDRLQHVRAVSFDWNDVYQAMGRASGHREIGVIAQDVEAVFPELVSKWGEQGYRAVDYGRMTAVLIEAIKELRAENDELRQRLESLEGPGR